LGTVLRGGFPFPATPLACAQLVGLLVGMFALYAWYVVLHNGLDGYDVTQIFSGLARDDVPGAR